MKINEIRVKRLKEFIESIGSAAAVARRYENIDPSYLSQLINGHRSFGEKAARKLEEILRLPQFHFDYLTETSIDNVKSNENSEILLRNNEEYPAIKRVNLKLSAGIVGFGIDYDVEDKTPIVMQREWFKSRGFKPEKLLATKVKGDSMQPGLYEGDTVVINTDDHIPIDGQVYAINYEGEMLIKRMIRDTGVWWLSSDNQDQRKHPRKECNSDLCIIIGKVVHKQSEVI